MRSLNQAFTYLLTLSILGAGWLVYEQTLSRLTDFEQIAPELLQPMAEDTRPLAVEPEALRESEIAAVRGFGPDCPELRAPLILESRKRSGPDVTSGRGMGIYVYAHDYEILKDNPRLIRLHPFSMVHLQRSPSGKKEEDEINTVRGEEAILEFDRPVELTKISGVKPIAGWVKGKVTLKSNRRTDDPDDDIVLFTERLDYREDKNLIWAEEQILVVEQEARVTGIGLELELHPELKPGQSRPKDQPRPKSEARRLRISRDVSFFLMIPEDENFLGPPTPGSSSHPAADATAANKNAPPGDAKRELVPVKINARGPFEFDLEKNVAVFRRSVRALRQNPPKKKGELETIDQLECDELSLQFRDKDDPQRPLDQPQKRANGDAKGGSLRLKSATATGQQVILLSDSERLQATGNYLFHDAESRRAILKSQQELVAIHENAIIHGRSLVIEQGENKSIRHFVVDGPNGWLEVLENDQAVPAPSKDEHPKAELKIRWQGRLTMTGKPGSETMIVNVDKHVELEDARGALKCDELKVWLAPISRPGEIRTTKRGKLEPIKLEAAGKVSAHSNDFSVVTENLGMDIIHLRDPAGATVNATSRPSAPTTAVAVAAPSSPSKPTASTSALSKPTASSSAGSKPTASKSALSKSAASKAAVEATTETALKTAPPVEKGTQAIVTRDGAAKEENDPPLDVRAKRVAIVIERIGSKSRPIKAWAEGDVLVTQPPTKPNQDPVEVRGQTLDFQRTPQGDIVEVGGNEKRLALIKTTEITLAGKQFVKMNEPLNRIESIGPGYFLCETDNDLSGKKSTKPQPLRIDWDKGMDSDGKQATFDGGVKAQQQTAEVHCQTMIVNFDQRIMFREMRSRRSSRDRLPAKIESIDCDKDVVVYDAERQEGVFVRHTTLRAPELHYDNLARTSEAKGPGVVQVIESNDAGNSKDPMAARRFPFQLTQVRFAGEMRSDQARQTVKFFEKVAIIHTPVDRLDEVVDEDHLPPEGMAIEADDSVIMAVREQPGGAKYRDFQAAGNVRAQSNDYWGHGDALSYDQQKDVLVFQGDANQKARFYRQLRVGEKPQEFSARTIKYSRGSGRINADAADGFNVLDNGLNGVDRGVRRNPRP